MFNVFSTLLILTPILSGLIVAIIAIFGRVVSYQKDLKVKREGDKAWQREITEKIIFHDKFIEDTKGFQKEVTRRLISLETKIDVFWSNLDKYFGSVVHSPHTQSLDLLIERWQNGEKFSNEDLKQMSNELDKDTDTNVMKVLAIQYLKARIAAILQEQLL